MSHEKSQGFFLDFLMSAQTRIYIYILTTLISALLLAHFGKEGLGTDIELCPPQVTIYP